MDPHGKVFVVTGAGSGIGRHVSLELIRRGATVAGADLSEAGLAETVRLAERPAFSSHLLDVSDRDAVAAFPAIVVAEHGRVDGVFNIAGIAQEFETVAEVTDERMETLMRVNFWGTVWMTRAFLPLLEERPDGGVVMNTSSLSALVPVPGAATYGATKAAVALFSYGLAQDLRKSSKVTVTTAIPGTVWTELVRKSAQKLGAPEVVARNFAMKPESAARRIVVTTMKGRMRTVVGKDAHFYGAVKRLSVSLAERASYLQVGTFVYRQKD